MAGEGEEKAARKYRGRERHVVDPGFIGSECPVDRVRGRCLSIWDNCSPVPWPLSPLHAARSFVPHGWLIVVVGSSLSRGLTMRQGRPSVRVACACAAAPRSHACGITRVDR